MTHPSDRLPPVCHPSNRPSAASAPIRGQTPDGSRSPDGCSVGSTCANDARDGADIALTCDREAVPLLASRDALGSPTQERWQGWTLDADRLTLDYRTGRVRYYVDLERSLDPGQLLDHVVQVSHKRWASPAVVGGLVRALDDVLRLQRNLCGFGACLSITPERVAELARASEVRS